MRKTKTVVTIGPASEPKEVLSQLIDAGMDIARINFSHADHAEALPRIQFIRELNAEKGTNVTIMQDLCGPRIRIGEIPGGRRPIEPGQELTFYTLNAPDPQEDEILIKDPYLHRDAKVGGRFLLDSGTFHGEVTSVDVERQRITVRILNGGELLSNKGVNVPGVKLTTASPTEKDKIDAAFGREQKVEHVAVSFVQSRKELDDVRALLDPSQKVWAKVEDEIGVKNLDEIIEGADGIIVARGDLGVEVPLEEVPFIQKLMVKKCNEAGKPVVVATQMLVSMMKKPSPTRAEVSDIATAVLDGADYVWLSEETTIGEYPVKAVETLTRVAERADEYKENPTIKI